MSQLLDVTKIKKDFPIFERTINGEKLVYLDSAATSQKPLAVLDAERSFYLNHNAAPIEARTDLRKRQLRLLKARAKVSQSFSVAQLMKLSSQNRQPNQ